MGCVLYTNNTSGDVLAANAQISFGTIIHRKGRAANLVGNEIVVHGGCSDYATVSGVANLIAGTAGDMTVTFIVDGTPELAISATAAAEGDYVAIPFTFVLKGTCCGPHRIIARTGAACTLNSFPVKVDTV